MKKQILLKILLPTLVFLIQACSPDFLDVAVQGKGTAATDPDLAANLVVGVYNSLLSGDAFGGGDTHGIAFISATNIMADDADKGSTAQDQIGIIGELDNFTQTPTNTFVASLWSGYFSGIAKCNQALKALETSLVDESIKNRWIGEVRFIRGYYYFNLVRLYGGVPLVLRVPASAEDANTDPKFQTRATAAEIYTTIIEDLQFAADHTPLRNATEKGRINKGTAQSLLAKVYLYEKNWQKVFELTSQVISSGQYALLPDYEKIWREAGNNSSESIFEIQTGVFNNSDFGVNGYCVWQGPRVGGKGGWTDLGFGFCTPNEQFVNSYETGDKRRLATVIEIDRSSEHKGTVLYDGFRIPSSDSVQNFYYNYKAYHSENKNIESFLGNRDNKQKNIHLLRFADVLLMHAEAANNLGQTGVAQDELNRIRTRAGLPNTTATGGKELQEAIWKERRYELAMEHDRFFDLVRQGTVATAMAKVGKVFVTGKNELLPVPALQIELSGNKLSQNPGY